MFKIPVIVYTVADRFNVRIVDSGTSNGGVSSCDGSYGSAITEQYTSMYYITFKDYRPA